MHLWGRCWRMPSTTLRTHPENLWYKKRWENVWEKVTNLYENVIVYIIVYIQIKVLNVVFDKCIAGVETRLLYRYTCIYYDKYLFCNLVAASILVDKTVWYVLAKLDYLIFYIYVFTCIYSIINMYLVFFCILPIYFLLHEEL